MDPINSNSSIPQWTLIESPPEERDHFPPISSQNPGTGRLNYYIDGTLQEKANTLDPVIEAVKLLADLGLNPRQIRQLRHIEYRNALYCLADTDEDELDEACAVLRLQQCQSVSRHHSLRLSSRSSSRYPSGVPSLISDCPSLGESVATDISFPMQHYNGGGSDYVGEMTAPDNWPSYSGDKRYTIGLPVIEEGPFYQESNVVMFTTTGMCSHPQNIETTPCVVPDRLDPPHHQNESTPNPQVSAGRHAFLREQEQPSNRYQRPKFPCSESGCPSNFSSENEFAKHLTGHHDKDVIFACKHKSCPLHPFENSRIEMWKRHHSTHHRGCIRYETCKEERRVRAQRKYWACGLCEDLLTDVKSYAKHYKNHFSDGRHQQKDVDFSTIIRSLLRQDATSHKWSTRNVDRRDSDGTFHLFWEPENSTHLREALEYGTFQGLSIDEPDVVDRLLDEVVNCARQHRKRHASSSPTPEDSQPVSSQSFQRRLYSSDEYLQLRAGTASAIAQYDALEGEL